MEQVIKKQVRKLTLNDDIVVGVNPTTVEVVPSLSSGIEIAKIFVNGEKSTIYGTKGGGITDVLVDGTTIKKTVDEGRLYVGSITKSKVSDFGSYLTSTTFIPSKTSDLQNDSGFVVSSSISSHLSGLEEKIDHKIFINNPYDDINDYANDLSIVKIPADEFYKMVADDVELLSNILYVVESDYLHAAGRQLCNLTMNNSEDPTASYEGIAATDKYVNNLCANICTKVNNLSTALSTDVRNLMSNIEDAEEEIEAALTSLNNVKVDKIGEETINLDDFTVEGYLKYLTTKMGGTAN